MADDSVDWDAALTELAASSALLERLAERPDAASPQVVEASRIAHGRLLSVLANAGASTPS